MVRLAALLKDRLTPAHIVMQRLANANASDRLTCAPASCSSQDRAGMWAWAVAYLFAGSDEGAANWAAIASLVEPCKLNAVEPQGYLTELLTRLVNGWPQARIDEFMPWHWATSTPY